MQISTKRLLLIAANTKTAEAEISNKAEFGRLLEADIPNNWPPENTRDVLEFFKEKITESSNNPGWYTWYVILVAPGEKVLIGSIGFFGPPDSNSCVETGYSLLPQFEGLGYATEMLKGLTEHLKSSNVKSIKARTDKDNIKSQNVLKNNSFELTGVDEEDKFIFIKTL